MTETPPRTVTYYGVSLFTSRTFIVNLLAFAVAIGPELLAYLSSSEVKVLIPARYMPLYGAAVAGLNIFLRTRTVRPVAFIKPGDTQPVQVVRIGPPPPEKITD